MPVVALATSRRRPRAAELGAGPSRLVATGPSKEGRADQISARHPQH